MLIYWNIPKSNIQDVLYDIAENVKKVLEEMYAKIHQYHISIRYQPIPKAQISELVSGVEKWYWSICNTCVLTNYLP